MAISCLSLLPKRWGLILQWVILATALLRIRPCIILTAREVIARDNEISLLRKTDMSKAYFSCHTDITIPYSELGDIKAVRADGSRIDIIRQGRFVLEGTEELNEALDEADDGAAGLDCE